MSPPAVRLLDPEIVSRIAAGEVVDRPASVLKELLDNSIDAGATHIRVLVIDAGLRKLEVEDNGAGMSPEDLKVCTLRHATSKIQKLDDLDAILSLGFRGEALAAVASVAKLKIETARGDSGAWIFESLGSTQGSLKPTTRSKGTKVTVEDLFFNVPARKKFLKNVSSEFSETRDVLWAVALAHPSIAFEWHFITDKGELKEQESLHPSSLAERLRALHKIEGEILVTDGKDTMEGILRAEAAFYKAPVASRFQKSIHLTVNGRPIQDKRLPYSLREAYSGLIEVGQYPVGVLHLEVDPSLIDVNIHPQKKEIRWPKEFNLSSFAYRLLRPHFEVRNLASFSTQSTSTQEISFWETSLSSPELPSISSTASRLAYENLSDTASSSASSLSSFSPAPKESISAPIRARLAAPIESRPTFRFQELRVVGELGAAWIVCEAPTGMILIDQHAAHERVNFELILRSKTLLRSKALLIPYVQTLPPYLADQKEILIKTLEDLGFEVSQDSQDSSEDSLEFIAVPEADRYVPWDSILSQIFLELQSGQLIEHWPDHLKYKLAASLSCHGSVRRGQRLNHDQIKALLVSMDEIQWGGLCPHGRPVWLSLSHDWIEEQFHR